MGNTECKETLLTRKIDKWFKKAGGIVEDITPHSFKEILQSNDGMNAWQMVEKWLSTQHYKTKEVLEISKVVPEKGKPDDIVKGISERRPGRLMTPAMVWACLLGMRSENKSMPIITLGGFDERSLWDAWHQCVEHPEIQLGHLFISKLQHQNNTVSMAQFGEKIHWKSRQDIQDAFSDSLKGSDGVAVSDEQKHQMIPWCLNNCVALPNRVAGKSPLQIGDQKVAVAKQCVEYMDQKYLEDCVEAVSKWLL